jgi:hypothetical protein
MRPLKAAAAIVAVMWFNHIVAIAAHAGGASANDNARFLAGMPIAGESPIKSLADEGAWRAHAQEFDRGWAELEARQMKRVRAWSASHLTAPRQTLFYMFSGPDFLYADAFFPDATTYVLSGLEPVGAIPDVTRLNAKSLQQPLSRLRGSLKQVLGHSYFITLEMGKQLYGGEVLNGTLPVLYVFLARTGKVVKDVSYMQLAADGSLTAMDGVVPGARPKAVRIIFSGPDGRERTLYYFSTNLSNKGVAESGLLAFCAKLAPGDSFIKSASYLLHGSEFSTVRDFLLENSAQILQDDTGIPVRNFNTNVWELQPFGNYTRPIAQFGRKYQKGLTELFAKGKPGPMDFGVGYKWRPGKSHLVRAIKVKSLT